MGHDLLQNGAIFPYSVATVGMTMGFSEDPAPGDPRGEHGPPGHPVVTSGDARLTPMVAGLFCGSAVPNQLEA
jgi:hypothetical protein